MSHKKLKDTQAVHYLQAHSAMFGIVMLGLLIAYIFVPQLENLKLSLEAMKSANPAYIIAAIIVFCAGFPILAFKYCKISIIRLAFLLTLKVQIAGAFVSKLLPQSVGSLTVNTYYLTAAGHTVAQSATVMALNALTSSIGFGIIVITAIIIGGTSSLQNVPHSIGNISLYLLIMVVVLIALWLVLRIKPLRIRIASFIHNMWSNFATYKDHPSKVTWGIIGNVAGSMTGITALYLCAHAVGLPVTMPQVVISYAFGSIMGNLVPTPGGLGGAEAGLYAGFVLAGYDESLSFAAVMTYRFITYWLPIIPGYFMYRSLRKTTFKNFKIKATKATA